MLALTIGGAVFGYWVVAGVTHAVLVHTWGPVVTASKYPMDVIAAEYKNKDRDAIRGLGAALWPATLVVVCLRGITVYSGKWTARILKARKPRVVLPRARTVTND